MSDSVRRAKVTVCVATYNQQSYIRDCLLSILMQDCPADLEILVGNDGSTDNTGLIISDVAGKFPGRFTILPREKNLGPSENYQDMIRQASGDYIAHIDGDDYWMPNKLAAQLAFFAENPDCAAIYSNAHVISDTGQLIGIFNNPQPAIFDTEYLLRRGNFLNHSSMFYRAEFKNEITELSGSFIDYRMHLRLSRHGKLGYINRDLVAYRSGSSNSMIKYIPFKVNDMYWEAITDPEILPRYEASSTSAQIYFYAHILYNAVRKNRLPYARHWASRIRSERHNKSTSIFVRSVLLIPAIFWRSLKRKIATTLSGSEFYPRYER